MLINRIHQPSDQQQQRANIDLRRAFAVLAVALVVILFALVIPNWRELRQSSSALNGASGTAMGGAAVAARKELGAMGLKYNEHTFIECARSGDVIGVGVFVDAGMRVDVVDEETGHTALSAAAQKGRLGVVRGLLDKGADVNARNQYGSNALDDCIVKGHVEVVKQLLDRGIDVNASNTWGHTPLMMAALNGRVTITEMLLSKGANPNVKDKSDMTPLKNAEQYQHRAIIEMLKRAGATQ